MNYLFAGASSNIAICSADILNDRGHRIIGISTKSLDGVYDSIYQVPSYDQEHLPEINDAIDGLVYFPGTINLKPFARISKKEFMHDFEINVLGAIDVIQKYLPALKKSSHASIVLISSVAATVGMPFHTSVSAAKSGLEGFSKALAAELAPNVRVNCVAPSLVKTTMAERLINTEEKETLIKNRNPLKKIGQPEDVASMVCYLLSTEASWISGQTFAVDGGMNHLKI